MAPAKSNLGLLRPAHRKCPHKTEVLARGSSASTSPRHSVGCRPRRDSRAASRRRHGPRAQAAALRALRKAQPVYDTLIALADPARTGRCAGHVLPPLARPAASDARRGRCRRVAELSWFGRSNGEAAPPPARARCASRGARGGLAPGLPPRQDGGGHEPARPVRAAALPARPREDRRTLRRPSPTISPTSSARTRSRASSSGPTATCTPAVRHGCPCRSAISTGRARRRSGTRRPPRRSAARSWTAPTGIARGCTARRSSTAACHAAPI